MVEIAAEEYRSSWGRTSAGAASVHGVLVPSVLVALAFVLRVYLLGNQSLWFDEGYSVYLARMGPGPAIWATAADAHPPLYHLLLAVWLGLAGPGEFAVRFLSAMLGTLTVPLSYCLGRRLFGRPTASITAALVAASPFLVYYSQEARMYGLLLDLALVASWLLLRAVRSGRFWALYAVALAAAFYTHYSAMLLALAHLAFVGAISWTGRVGARSPSFRNLTFCLLAIAAAGAMFLPWVGVLLEYRQTSLDGDGLVRLSAVFHPVGMPAGRSDRPPSPSHGTPPDAILLQSLTAFATGYPVGGVGALAGPGNIPGSPEALIFSLPYMAAAGLGIYTATRGTPGQQSAGNTAYLSLGILVPMAGMAVLSASSRDFTPRYLVFVAPCFLLLVGAGLFYLLGRSRVGFIVVLAPVLASSAYWLGLYYFDPTYWRDDHRSVARYLERMTTPEDGVILNAPYFYPVFTYYYHGPSPWYGLPAEHPADRPRTEARLAELASQHPYLWLVLWQDYYSDPEGVVAGWLRENGMRLEEASFHGGIRVEGYYVGPWVLDGPFKPGKAIGRVLGDAVELLGYDLRSTPAPGEPLRLVLYWRTFQPLDRDYTIIVHLLDAAGNKVSQDDGVPQDGRLPTSTWPVGRIVRDERRLLLPSDHPPGSYAVRVGFYDYSARVSLGGKGSDRIEFQLDW